MIETLATTTRFEIVQYLADGVTAMSRCGSWDSFAEAVAAFNRNPEAFTRFGGPVKIASVVETTTREELEHDLTAPIRWLAEYASKNS